ncbi:MAG: translocase, partial [Gammaproteobacteria bacterium]
MKTTNSLNPVERFLGLFADVRSGEGTTIMLLTLNLFIILIAYYIAKVVREPLILAGGGAEVKSYSAAGQAVLLLFAVPLYAWLASNFPRRKLINIVTLFFAGCLVLFYLFSQSKGIGVVFYLWVGIFSLMVIAQFWAFANDLYSPEAGKRVFAIVAFGGSFGAVFGSYFAGQLIEPIGIYNLLLVSSGLLGLSLLITNYVDIRERNIIRHTIKHNTSKTSDKPDDLKTEVLEMGKQGAFKLVWQNQYLLLIGILLLLLNWVNTTGEYIMGKIVSTEAVASATAAGLTGAELQTAIQEFIGGFYADFFTIVNFAGVVIQLFLVSRILKFFGVRIAILILPVIAFGGYILMAFYPILGIIRWAKTAENSTDYSLHNTVRQVLFLPTNREQKYKAKQAIDTFFVRAGD